MSKAITPQVAEVASKLHEYLKIPSHPQRVKSLYKKVIRNLESFLPNRAVFRYNAALMRHEFDKNADVDGKKASSLVIEGEKQLHKRTHWHVRKFVDSPGGTAYNRDPIIPDWVLDYWHPIEKAQYPEYFARREKRKKEYIKRWVDKYGTHQAHTYK